MQIQTPQQTAAPTTTEPAIQPSLPKPQTDPLYDVRDVVAGIRQQSMIAPREYLSEIRVVLGAE